LLLNFTWGTSGLALKWKKGELAGDVSTEGCVQIPATPPENPEPPLLLLTLSEELDVLRKRGVGNQSHNTVLT
jgi:hypothetical protein